MAIRRPRRECRRIGAAGAVDGVGVTGGAGTVRGVALPSDAGGETEDPGR